MSQERELKFRLDPALHDAVRQHPVLLTLAEHAEVLSMQTWYFDTPAQTLRQAGLALRIRHLADGQRILTLKSSPAQGLQLARGEWEFPIDTDVPEVSALQRLDHTPLAKLDTPQVLARQLRAVLGTRVKRTVWQMRWQDTRLEVCLDEGHALGGTHSGAPSLPISELEIELVEGHWPHAFDLAWTLAQDLPLLLSPVSKLQLAACAAGAATLQLPTLAREVAPHPRGGQAVADALQQATAFIAIGADLLLQSASAETVHQLRLQLRRLRVLLRLLQTMGPKSQRAACRWLRNEWRWAGQLLGAVRDVDVCLEQALSQGDGQRPGVSAACESLARRRQARLTALQAYLRSARWGRVLLAQARWAECWSSGQVVSNDLSTDQLARRLLHFHRDDLSLHPQRWAEILAIWERLAATPAEAPWAALHTLRLRAKRLRYTLEWLGPWVAAVLGDDGKAWLKLAGVLQTDLGAALDTLRLARWLDDAALATDPSAEPSQPHSVDRAFDLARIGLTRALSAARQ